MNKKIDKIIHDIILELENSNELHCNFHSSHEWYGVLKEEVDELWDEIKNTKYPYTCNSVMKKEAIQIAAMAIKGILSLCKTDFS